MKNLIFALSALLNVILLFSLFFNWFNAPTYNYGKLKEDIEVGVFMSDDKVFKIPAGITVQDVSPRGIDAIGRFENNRFSIIVSSEAELVDYKSSPDSLLKFGNIYSADSKFESDN